MRRRRAWLAFAVVVGVVWLTLGVWTWVGPDPIPFGIEEANATWVDCPEGHGSDDPDPDCRLLTGKDAIAAKAAWEASRPAPRP